MAPLIIRNGWVDRTFFFAEQAAFLRRCKFGICASGIRCAGRFALVESVVEQLMVSFDSVSLVNRKADHQPIHKRTAMKAKSFCAVLLGLAMLLAFPGFATAQDLKPIQLPKTQMDGGKPLMQVLKERKSTRSFSSARLPMQTPGNSLWAVFGINRPGTPAHCALGDEPAGD